MPTSHSTLTLKHVKQRQKITDYLSSYRPAKENLSKFTAAVRSVACWRRRGDAKLPRVSNWGYRIHCGYIYLVMIVVMVTN